MKRINLTQHDALPEQGCMERGAEQAAQIRRLLTFDELPRAKEVADRATALADVAWRSGADEAMIGGASYLMEVLPIALRLRGVVPVYAFSLRESVDEIVTRQRASGRFFAIAGL